MAFKRTKKRKSYKAVYICNVCGREQVLDTRARHWCTCNPIAPYSMYHKAHTQIIARLVGGVVGAIKASK